MKEAAVIVAGLKVSRVNIIDVGCHTGKVTADFVSYLPGKQIFSVGIDPIYHLPVYSFTRHIQVAISNCAPQEVDFYQYSDPMCSSLLKMTTNITHDPAERDTKWFGAHDFEHLQNVKRVVVMPLASIIEEVGLADEVIHFLKIDAQGSDLKVFLSAGMFIKNCLFVQMETVVSGNPEIVLYEGQGIYERDRLMVEDHGFEVFSYDDHGATLSPEADVIYVNKELLKRLEN